MIFFKLFICKSPTKNFVSHVELAVIMKNEHGCYEQWHLCRVSCQNKWDLWVVWCQKCIFFSYLVIISSYSLEH